MAHAERRDGRDRRLRRRLLHHVAGTGKYKGKGIGKISAQGDGKYSGSITDPATDKTYNGRASISGSSMKMKGCVLGGLLCKSQNWTKM